jgi:cell division protein ZapA
MDQSSRVVNVDIHGQMYPIRSGLDPAYVAELAAFVNEKMQLAARESPAGETVKLAVLAALNIADECFRARDEGRRHHDNVAHRAEELERMLDLALGLGEPQAAAR